MILPHSVFTRSDRLRPNTTFNRFLGTESDKSLIDDLIMTKELLSEEGHGEIKDPQTWCEEQGYFSLKSLLTKINAIQQAAKGKFGS